MKKSNIKDILTDIDTKIIWIQDTLDYLKLLSVDSRQADRTVYSIESRLNTLIWDCKEMIIKRKRKQVKSEMTDVTNKSEKVKSEDEKE